MATEASSSVEASLADLTAMKLGVVVLHEQLSRVLAIDALSPDGVSQVSDAVLYTVSPAFIGEDLADTARQSTGRR